jgi:hydroxyacyl-ACP dehydratase HTD2-like protein with hotdog domain
MAMPMVNSLGASGYPALQTFLSHILDKDRLFYSGKKMFFVLMAAVTFEVLEEVM